ncbi:MAG: hypothetical protein EA377_07355 [Phycisphaerales bacterium]|nr:MAG: hypothetical protein EA377_07355 [Phycisphaerales bacterium]
MAEKKDKTLMRNLGEFVGHIVRAVKTEPKVRRIKHEEDDHGNMIVRRTTIEEIEFRDMRK